MKRILEYKLPLDGKTITINANVIKWLEIKTQNGQPYIGAIVDDSVTTVAWTIIAWGTGWEVPKELLDVEYLGTAQDYEGYVWHYFGDVAAIDYMTIDLDYAQYSSNSVLTTVAQTQSVESLPVFCGDADLAVSALESKVYNDCTTSIDGLQSAVEYLTAAVATGKTAAVKVCT